MEPFLFEKIEAIRTFHDPVMNYPCKELENFDVALGLENKLKERLNKESNGIGLAANQIGLTVKAFAYDLSETKQHRKVEGVAFNPVITDSGGTATHPEGCLSIPGLFWEIERPSDIEVRFYDSRGVEHTQEFSGLAARLFQHEIDHLNGVLMFDKIVDPAEKQVAIARAVALLEEVTGSASGNIFKVD